jgi:outer membrane lipoprotein carrier protein
MPAPAGAAPVAVMRLGVSALCLALAFAGVAALHPGPAAALTLDEAVAALEQAQRRVTDLKAPFRQAAHNKTLNQTIDARGTLYLKKPGRLRWEYQTPTPQEIVSDGTRLWIYTPELKQVNVSAAPAALAGPAGSFLHGLGQVREHFEPRFLNPAQPTDAEGLVVLDLVPKRPQPLLARLIVSVDPKTWLVRQAVIHDELGNTVTVRFGDPVVNSGLADSLFVFVPPPGVAVVQH